MFTHAIQRMYMLSPITDVDQFKPDTWSAAKSHSRTPLDSCINVNSSIVRKKHSVLGKHIVKD